MVSVYFQKRDEPYTVKTTLSPEKWMPLTSGVVRLDVNDNQVTGKRKDEPYTVQCAGTFPSVFYC